MNLVETGIQDEKYIEIKSGIEDVKKVVRGPFDAVSRKLSDGSNIIVSEKTKF
jgi:HlyD family secretion protein